MEKFLAEALLPKAMRKRPLGQGDRSSPAQGSTSTGTPAKRPRPRPRPGAGCGGKKLESAQPTLEAAKAKATPTPATSAPAQPPAHSAATSLPSFRDVMSGQSTPTGQTRTRLLYDKANALVQEGHLGKGLKLLKRALIACACHAPLRRQFQDAGVPLESIDPIRYCSCRDFVAAAQTRRPAVISGRTARSTLKKTDSSSYAISELDLTAVHTLATNGSVCMCGSGRTRCTLPDHLDTLDRLTAIAIQLGQIDLAFEVSQWHIDLAPHQPQGYLHLAKAVLLKEPQSRFKALCIYNHGRHNVRQYGDPESPFLRYLTRGCRQYNQCDFLVCLPRETAELIFDQLSLTDVLTCLRVSKDWAAALRQMRLRLPLVRLPGARFLRSKPQRQLPLRGLGKLLKCLPGLRPRHLNIRFYSNPGGQYAQFVEGAMRHFGASAECLELSTWWGTKMPQSGREPVWSLHETSQSVTTSSRCRKLVLHDEGTNNLADIRGIIGWASRSLEHLELKGDYNGILDFSLPHLRVFRAIGGVWCNTTTSNHFEAVEPCIISSICAAAPKLEQLSLENILFKDQASQLSVDERRQSDSMLQSLHTLHIGPGSQVDAMLSIFPKLPLGMRCIDIACSSPDVAEMILFGADRGISEQENYLQPFEKLEAFRCVSLKENPQRVFDLIRPSLNGPDGRLAHIELPAESLGMDFVQGNEPYMFHYPERLRTVGLHQFDWNPGPAAPHMLGHMMRDGPFLDWAAQFRHAESISVYPMWQTTELRGSENAMQDGMLVAELVRRFAAIAHQEDNTSWSKMRLRTVYQGLLHGPMHGYMEQLQKETFGQQMIRFPRGHSLLRAPIFPWPDLVEDVTEAAEAAGA